MSVEPVKPPGVERIMSMEVGSDDCKAAALAFLEHELVYVDNLTVTDKLIGPATWRTSTTAAQFALERTFGPRPSVPHGAP